MKTMVGVTLGISVFNFMALYILQVQVMRDWTACRVFRIAVELRKLYYSSEVFLMVPMKGAAELPPRDR
jgi:hypothetical protein